MATVRIEGAVIIPKYNDDNGGSGFLEARLENGKLLLLHVDGSLVDNVVREQVRAVCELAGMDEPAIRAEMERVSALAQANLEANRRNRQ